MISHSLSCMFNSGVTYFTQIEEPIRLRNCWKLHSLFSFIECSSYKIFPHYLKNVLKLQLLKGCDTIVVFLPLMSVFGLGTCALLSPLIEVM